MSKLKIAQNTDVDKNQDKRRGFSRRVLYILSSIKNDTLRRKWGQGYIRDMVGGKSKSEGTSCLLPANFNIVGPQLPGLSNENGTAVV